MRDTKQWVSKVKQVDPPELWSEVLRRSEFAEPMDDAPRRPSVGMIVLLAGTLVIVAVALYALSGLRSTPADVPPPPSTARYVNPMGIPITLSYPTTWHLQETNDPNVQGVHRVGGVVVSNASEAMPSPSAPTPSPGPLPTDPALPADFVTVTILARDGPPHWALSDSPLPLSMSNAKIAPSPGPASIRTLGAVVAGKLISISVQSGPRATSTDLALADAIVASIRPNNKEAAGHFVLPEVPTCAPKVADSTLEIDTTGKGDPVSLTRSCYYAPSGADFKITFSNQVVSEDGNGTLQNLSIYKSQGAGVTVSADATEVESNGTTAIFRGDTVEAPGTTTYSVPGLQAGTYWIQSDYLPGYIFATLVVN
jgi:hypothetical protein